MNPKYSQRLRDIVLFLFVLISFNLKAQDSSVQIAIKDLSEEEVLTVNIPDGRKLKISLKNCSADGIDITYVDFYFDKDERDTPFTVNITALNEGIVDERVVEKSKLLTLNRENAGKVLRCTNSALSKMLILKENGSTPFFDELLLQF